MSFAREVPPEALLPMGFVNSVAIAQHVHRRVISQALYSGQGLASRHREIRPTAVQIIYSGCTWTISMSYARWIREWLDLWKENRLIGPWLSERPTKRWDFRVIQRKQWRSRSPLRSKGPVWMGVEEPLLPSIVRWLDT